MRCVKAALFIGLSLVISACAVSPQHVNIHPSVNVATNAATTQSVVLKVQDNRGQVHLGTRGGVYANTSFIYPAQSLADSVLDASVTALSSMGFNTQAPGPSPVHLTIYIDELSYSTDDSGLPKKVTLRVKLRTEAVKTVNQTEMRQQAGYGSSKTHSFVATPDNAENEKIINEILSETLTNLFNDPKLIEFMR